MNPLSHLQGTIPSTLALLALCMGASVALSWACGEARAWRALFTHNGRG